MPWASYVMSAAGATGRGLLFIGRGLLFLLRLKSDADSIFRLSCPEKVSCGAGLQGMWAGRAERSPDGDRQIRASCGGRLTGFRR